jgi:hexokinase
MPTDKTTEQERASIIREAMALARNSAFLAAIEICISLDGYCNACCARAIDMMRRETCAEVIDGENEVRH